MAIGMNSTGTASESKKPSPKRVLRRAIALIIIFISAVICLFIGFTLECLYFGHFSEIFRERQADEWIMMIGFAIGIVLPISLFALVMFVLIKALERLWGEDRKKE